MSRPGINSRIEGEATSFRIWREGQAVNWDCTILELADATGLHPQTVFKHVRRRGWPVRGWGSDVEELDGSLAWVSGNPPVQRRSLRATLELL